MWAAIVGKLAGAFGEEVAGYYRDKQRLKHELKLEQIRTKVELQKARTVASQASEDRDARWEELSIKNSGWKDEWVLVLLSIPLVLCFLPWTVVYVQMGFSALAQTPDWYQWLIMIIFTAIYGIRLWRRKT